MSGRRSAIGGLALAFAIGAAGVAFGSSTEARDEAPGGARDRAALAELAGFDRVSSVAGAERRAARAGVRGKTLRVVAHELDFQFVDLPPKGDSMGDFFWSTGTLYNASHTKVIERQFLRCEFTNLGAWCEQPLRLRHRGKLLLSNPIIRGNDVVSVVGGTGDFRDAAGQAKLFVLDNGHTFDILFVIDVER